MAPKTMTATELKARVQAHWASEETARRIEAMRAATEPVFDRLIERTIKLLQERGLLAP